MHGDHGHGAFAVDASTHQKRNGTLRLCMNVLSKKNIQKLKNDFCDHRNPSSRLRPGAWIFVCEIRSWCKMCSLGCWEHDMSALLCIVITGTALSPWTRARTRNGMEPEDSAECALKSKTQKLNDNFLSLETLALTCLMAPRMSGGCHHIHSPTTSPQRFRRC